MQLLGVGGDPGSVDAEPRGQLRGVDEPHAQLRARLLDQRDDPPEC